MLQELRQVFHIYLWLLLLLVALIAVDDVVIYHISILEREVRELQIAPLLASPVLLVLLYA